MKDKLLIHVPHSSLALPEEFMTRVLFKREEILRENKFLCDLKVENFIPKDFKSTVIFPYSRMFCDVERFRSDELESMAKLGMGAVYKKDTNGIDFIEYDEEYKNYVLDNFYDKHHFELENTVEEIINSYGTCEIIDLHSFSDLMVYKLFKRSENPDICIGVEESFCDYELVELTKSYFEKLRYSVKINYPYQGSLVPTKYYFSLDKRVKSLMIEINKRVYLYDEDKYLEFNDYMNGYFEKVFKLKR